MNTIKILKTAVACLAMSASLVAQQSSVLSRCNPVPIRGLSLESRVEIRTSVLEEHPNYTHSGISLRNLNQRAITEGLLVVDYLMGDGRRLFSATYYGHYGSSNPPLPSLRAATVEQWLSPLLSREDTGFGFTSQSVALTCPELGQVTKISLKYEDGSTFSAAAPDWSTDPLIAEAQAFDLSAFPSVIPAEFVTTLHVDEEGHAAVATVEEESKGIRDWLGQQIIRWRIIPPDGTGRQDHILRLLVRIHSKSDDGLDLLSEREKKIISSSPAIIVDVVPSTTDSRKYFVLVGGMLATREALAAPH